MYSFLYNFHSCHQLFSHLLHYQPTLTVDKSKLKIKSFHLIDRKKNPFHSSLHPPKYSTIFICYRPREQIKTIFLQFFMHTSVCLVIGIFIDCTCMTAVHCHCCWALYNTLNPPSQLSSLPFFFFQFVAFERIIVVTITLWFTREEAFKAHSKKKIFFYLNSKKRKKNFFIEINNFIIF